MRKLVCPSFFSINYDEYSQDYGKIKNLTNKHIYVVEDFNEDGTIKGQIIKAVADRKGKLYKGNCPVPLNPGKYYFYVSDEEVEDINKITKDFCTDETEITDENGQSVELPNVIEKIINVNAYIIEGTYWDNYWDKPDMKKWDKDWFKYWDKKPVKEQFDVTEIIFNNHFKKYNYNIRIKFNITYYIIANSNLITIILSNNNTPLLETLLVILREKIKEETKEEIDEIIFSSFNIFFTNHLDNQTNEKDNEKNQVKKAIGVNFYPTTVAVISMGAKTIKITTAHEIGHILGLKDIKYSDDTYNLMMNPDNLPRDFNKITLTPDDIKLVEQYLKEFINKTGKFSP